MTSQIYVSVTTMGTFVVRIVQYCLMPYILTQRNCIQLSSWCFPKRISLFLCCYCSRCNGMYFAMCRAMPLNWTEQHIIGVLIHHFVGEMEMSSYLVYILSVDSRLAPSQLETSLQSNAVSHWLGAKPASALILLFKWKERNPPSRKVCSGSFHSR